MLFIHFIIIIVDTIENKEDGIFDLRIANYIGYQPSYLYLPKVLHVHSLAGLLANTFKT
jgi:hypothetical protein